MMYTMSLHTFGFRYYIRNSNLLGPGHKHMTAQELPKIIEVWRVGDYQRKTTYGRLSISTSIERGCVFRCELGVEVLQALGQGAGTVLADQSTEARGQELQVLYTSIHTQSFQLQSICFPVYFM